MRPDASSRSQPEPLVRDRLRGYLRGLIIHIHPARLMELSERAPVEDRRFLIQTLHGLYPEADCALRHGKAHELLFGTIMSAQTTDVNVNRVTEKLFQKYRSIQDFAEADPEVFSEEIRSTGFFRNKTRSVLGAARMLLDEYDGTVPDRMEDLVRLPGVARKTANVVLGTWFGKAEGVVVDTHVKRLAFRLGLTTETNPVKVERDLMAALPQSEWIFMGHAIILHGRAVCNARKPMCSCCALAPICPREGVATPV
jgi:endonuclease III